MTRRSDQLEGVSASVEIVTPVVARALLDGAHSFRNRNIRDRRVAALAAIIQEGRWRLNGESIVIDEDGVCIDGQHRLRAVIVAGVPIETVVARGVRRDVYLTIDQGARKTAADVLRAAGRTRCAATAAVVGMLLACEQGKHLTATVHDSERINLAVDEWPWLPEAVEYAHRVRGLSRCRKAIGMAFVVCHATERMPGSASRFFSHLENGSGLEVGNPVLTLRERLLRGASGYSKGSDSDPMIVAFLVLRAWQAWEAGDSLTRLALPKDGMTLEVFNAVNPLLG